MASDLLQQIAKDDAMLRDLLQLIAKDDAMVSHLLQQIVKDNAMLRDLLQLIAKDDAIASDLLQLITQDDAMRIRLISREKAEMDRVSEHNFLMKLVQDGTFDQYYEEQRLGAINRMRGAFSAAEISDAVSMPVADVEKIISELRNKTP